MQEEIERSDARFKQIFMLFNLGWMLVSCFSLAFSTNAALTTHPEYLHDWRGPVMFVMALYIPALFAWTLFVPRRKHAPEHVSWPPPLSFTLFYWINLYIIIFCLNLLDNDFVWCYFILQGITCSFFQKRRLLLSIAVIFLSYLYFLGILSWPLTRGQMDAAMGDSITFLSLTIVGITIQYLICERFQRRYLLRQLASTNEELETAHRQLAETAVQEQELAVLRERTRLAREVHDTLGYALVLVSVKLEAAQRLRELDPLSCDRELEATKGIVRSSMRELRASIANLRSPALEREPAGHALGRYAGEMAQRSDLLVSCDLHSDIEDLPAQVEDTLWKVGQEALANIEKHAQAHHVLLHISRREGQVFMKIADDGIGLPMHLCEQRKENAADYQSPAGHYGLNSMQERVKNVQGQWSIRSDSGQGTTIEVMLPLEEPV